MTGRQLSLVPRALSLTLNKCGLEREEHSVADWRWNREDVATPATLSSISTTLPSSS